MRSLMVILLLCFTLQSCALFEKRTETVYVKPDIPELKVYPHPKPLDLGELFNKEGKVCVRDWDACIPKEKFTDLLTYIYAIKTPLNKCNSQTLEFNATRLQLLNIEPE